MKKVYNIRENCPKCHEEKCLVIWRKFYEFPVKKITFKLVCICGHKFTKKY